MDVVEQLAVSVKRYKKGEIVELLHKIWHWFVTDDLKLRRWLRGFLMWLLTSLLQMSAHGVDVMAAWPIKKWIIAFGISAIGGLIGLINLGQMNTVPNIDVAKIDPKV